MRISVLLSFGLLANGCLPALAQPIPSLRPPRDEINPTFWEQHGLLIIIAAVVLLVTVATLLFLLLRPRKKLAEPPEVAARRSLTALRGRIADGALLMEVSQIFRHYVVFAFDLPPQELTTVELCATLPSSRKAEPGLVAAIGDFLRVCDVDKFSSHPVPPIADAAARALELLEKTEVRRRQFLPQPSTP